MEAYVESEDIRIIRPAAVLDERLALTVVKELERLDVTLGGVWNATTSLWQRYDRPWDGLDGTRGSAELIGSIAVMYDTPARRQITIYKVTATEFGIASGWTVDGICDEALASAGITLATCPRADLTSPPPSDPFRSR
ncbi:MAG: hypothetical protein WCL12_04410 [Actinomycetes bacterium]|jgi:hypothetical protein|nr:hypothetical protein [Actinomycetota bacterium]